jgi:hypothetical protein
VEHAPLLYIDDPRADLPEDQQADVAKRIKPVDETVVRGWLGVIE